MPKRKPRLVERPVNLVTPHILTISKALLLELINEDRAHCRQDPIPVNSCVVTIQCPSGGDYSGQEIELDLEDEITIKWSK